MILSSLNCVQVLYSLYFKLRCPFFMSNKPLRKRQSVMIQKKMWSEADLRKLHSAIKRGELAVREARQLLDKIHTRQVLEKISQIRVE